MGSPEGKNGLIHFGPFELDPDAQQLRKRGVVLKLQPKQFVVLHMLAQRAGEIVSRQQIQQRVWGDDTFVDFDRGINFCINQIRAALGDNAEKPRYIETVPRRGYRFIARVETDGLTGVDASATVVPAPDNHKDSASSDSTRINTSPTVIAAQSPALSSSRPAKGILIAGSLCLIALGGGLLLLLGWRPFPHQTKTNAAQVRTVPLATFPGEIEGLALSPDGRQIAFTWDGPNVARWNIYVQLIGGEAPLQITHTEGGMITGVDWSPDGRLLVFGRCGDNNRGALYTISPLGGQEHRLTDVTCNWGEAEAIWTPDGQSLVFSDSCRSGESLGVAVLTLTSGLKRCLAVAESNTVDLLNPTISPDGSTVAFVRMSTVRVSDIFTVPFLGGTPRRLTFEGRNALDVRWTKDGKALIFESDRGGVIGDNRWRISATGGPIEPVSDETAPSTSSPGRLFATASGDGRRTAYVDYRDNKFAIWRAHVLNGKLLSQEKLVESPQRIEGPQLSPDLNHIAFESFLSGTSNIWNGDADGHNALQLTSFGGELISSLRWSPDGKWIVFERRPADHAQIYVIDAEGKNMRAITEGDCENEMPTWSRDGKSIYFASNRTGTMQLWRQALGSSVATPITQHGGYVAAESYDRRYLYFAKFFSPGIWRIPIDGGEEEKVLPKPEAWYSGYWDITRTGLYFYDVAALPRPEIKFYDFKTRRTTTVLRTDGQAREWNIGISASRDGSTILYAVQYATSTVMIADTLH